MRRPSTLEKPDREFLQLANAIRDHCVENASAWCLPAERLALLSSLTAAANDAYAATSDRRLRNMESTARKNAAFRELKSFLGLFIDYLEGNLYVPDEALTIMGLRMRHRPAHHPYPVPTESPELLITRRHDELTVRVTRPAHNHPLHHAARRGYAGFKLRWRYEDSSEEHIELSTRLTHTLLFPRDAECKRIILSAAWVNPRLEAGPWSADITEVIG